MSAYEIWQEYAKSFPKTSRYSLGIRIDNLFFEVIESTSTAGFSVRSEKLPYVKRAITKLDTLKFFLQFAWQLHALDNKKYITLSESLSEVGRMLGGWHGQLMKQNSPTSGGGETK
ncbi:MAG: four helix bundle protein [bacterium]|nr:four helix bundle protein [bacterium]